MARHGEAWRGMARVIPEANMRPYWLRCESCLFFNTVPNDPEDVHLCIFNNIRVPIDKFSFCKEWTCTNCWEPWSTCDYEDDNDSLVGTFHQHLKCDPVKFREE